MFVSFINTNFLSEFLKSMKIPERKKKYLFHRQFEC